MKPVKVLAIAGTGKNGATLLSRLLGEIPGFVPVGEVADAELLQHPEGRGGHLPGRGAVPRRLPAGDPLKRLSSPADALLDLALAAQLVDALVQPAMERCLVTLLDDADNLIRVTLGDNPGDVEGRLQVQSGQHVQDAMDPLPGPEAALLGFAQHIGESAPVVPQVGRLRVEVEAQHRRAAAPLQPAILHRPGHRLTAAPNVPAARPPSQTRVVPVM